MQVHPNNGIHAAEKATVKPPAASRPSATTGSASFRESEALHAALRETPDVRTEAVAWAQDLIGDVQYPPLETIRGIAALLALHLDDDKK
jgi:hypothetical protein